MKYIRRSLVFVFITLFSILAMGAQAHAEPVIDPVVSPLRQNEPIIEEQSQLVAQKSFELMNTSNEILSLVEKKDSLEQKLNDIQSQVEDLNQKLADKKARAEAERKRVEELRNMFVHVSRFAGDSAGNTYGPGYCTWYAKSRRPDLPNNLGNANTWYVRAQAQGWNVGLTPKKGAVATTTAGWAGHVAYVEGVSLDGKYVTISEMNYRGLYSMNTRTVYYTEFQYIYELE